MENASKALLMAGGLLAGILVITSLAIMWSKMSGAKASQSGNAKTEQLAEFNAAFDSYANETVMGTDILSLFNRVNSYDNNLENDILLANIQYEHIKINVSIKNSQHKEEFKDVLKLNTDSTNANDIAKDTPSNDDTYSILNGFIELEKTVGRDNMTKLSSYYGANNGTSDPFTKPTYNSNGQPTNIVAQVLQEQSGLAGNPDKLRKAVITKYLGKNLAKYPTDKEIKNYNVYTSFKTTKFSCENVGYSDENGQVNSMNFEAKK